MTFKSACATDVQTVFLNVDEMAEQVDFHPDAGSTSFTAVVAFGDPPPSLVAANGGMVQTRVAQVLGFLANIQAGTQTVTGTARGPRLGDTIVVASGENAGTWTIESAIPDAMGGVLMTASHVALKAGGVAGSRVL